MKHRILYIFTAFVLFASCEDSDYDSSRYSASLYYVKADQDEVVFSALASSYELPLTYTSSEWTPHADCDWISASKADNGALIISVTDNDSGDARMGNAYIYMNGRSLDAIKVVQERAIVDVSVEELSFSTDSSSQTVRVSGNCNWSASSDSDWISAVKNNEEESVIVTVAENDTDATRKGKVGIYVNDLLLSSITISQQAPYAYPENVEVTYRAYEASHQIRISSNCSWTCTTDSDWLFVENSGKGEYLLIGVRENTTKSPRTAVVNIQKNNLILSSVKVTQKAADTPLVTGSNKPANCYIISKAGDYCFPPVKGNSNTSLSNVSSAEVLWETFGTSVKPAVGDLIESVVFDAGNICFSTPASFKEGNAVIAAKDPFGNILWSWHIWLTDQPQAQVYYNNAGTMMDRNLGATSSVPGDVGALGLLYQWGRKDPFLGASAIIYESPAAESTITWPAPVYSAYNTGTIEYSIAHPTTFIEANQENYDWYYSYYTSNDITRWPTSDKNKSIYDPCPDGWRIPDGGTEGVWAKALGSTALSSITFDKTNEGIDFSRKLGSASSIWYPAAGHIAPEDYGNSWVAGELTNVELGGQWWSASHYPYESGNANYVFASIFQISKYGDSIDLADEYSHANGLSVRCIKE